MRTHPFSSNASPKSCASRRPRTKEASQETRASSMGGGLPRTPEAQAPLGNVESDKEE